MSQVYAALADAIERQRKSAARQEQAAKNAIGGEKRKQQMRRHADEGKAVLDRLVEADAAVKRLAEVAHRALPFLEDAAEGYEDDGSNEPLETLRDLEEALERVEGVAP